MASKHLGLPTLLVLVPLSGCGGSELVDATGKLTYQGKPVPSTYVVFHPVEEGRRPSQGLTDDNGNFRLTHSRSLSGVLLGKHKVTLKYYVSGDEELKKTPPKVSPEVKAVIFKYRDPDTSSLQYEVTHNGQVFEIDLKD